MLKKFTKFELIGYPIFVVIMFIIDQTTKAIAAGVLPGKNTAVTIINHFFYFTYAQNYGGAWSLLEGHVYLFVIAAIAVAIMVVWWFLNSKPNDYLIRFGLILVLAGGIGNCVDRVVYGYVRDFIDFVIFGYDFPVFNIADICIVVGVILIILDTFEEEFIRWKQSRKQL